MEVEEKIRNMKTEHVFRSSGLHQRLAFAFQEMNRLNDAFEHYLVAADAFIEQGELKSAEQTLQDAQKLRIQQTPKQKSRWELVVNELNKAKGG